LLLSAAIRAISADIAATSAEIEADRQDDYQNQRRNPADRYQSDSQVKQELFKALATGLQINTATRLGRPLGTFERPRPKQVEGRRSGRRLRHVTLSLEALKTPTISLTDNNTDLVTELQAKFDAVLKRAAQLADPVLRTSPIPLADFESKPCSKGLQIFSLWLLRNQDLHWGVDAGFNSLDGD